MIEFDGYNVVYWLGINSAAGKRLNAAAISVTHALFPVGDLRTDSRYRANQVQSISLYVHTRFAELKVNCFVLLFSFDSLSLSLDFLFLL